MRKIIPKTKVGYEIPFTRYFYKNNPPRSLEEINVKGRRKCC